MKGLIILMSAAATVALAAPAAAGDRKPPRETPYSNAAVAREREARRIEREIAKDRREEERRERAYKPYVRRAPDLNPDDDCDCEDYE